MTDEPQEEKSVVVEMTTLQAISKAELDQQIATARAFPRSVTRFMQECKTIATLNEEVAGECIYAIPRKEDGKVKMIEGPSARLAEIVAHSWGNCRAGARVLDDRGDFVTAQGVFHDLERNVAITYEVRRRIVNKRGDRFSTDMIAVTANAAASIALRNAVFKGVPKALWTGVYLECRRIVAGDAKTLVNRRSEALGALQKLGATREMVLALLGCQGVEDIGLEEIANLRGIYTAIRDGEITVEEAFQPKETAGGGEKPATQPAGATKTEKLKNALSRTPAKDTPPGAQATDAVPFYNAETAIAAIRKAESLKELSTVYSEIVDDFKKTQRELPIDVEASRNDRRTALEQREGGG